LFESFKVLADEYDVFDSSIEVEEEDEEKQFFKLFNSKLNFMRKFKLTCAQKCQFPRELSNLTFI